MVNIPYFPSHQVELSKGHDAATNYKIAYITLELKQQMSHLERCRGFVKTLHLLHVKFNI